MTCKTVANAVAAQNDRTTRRPDPARGESLYSNGLPALIFLVLLAVGAIISQRLTIGSPARETQSVEPMTFSFCASGPRNNCVVDGDTFWLNGEKIRIADIDTPELSPPRCETERRLGMAAKRHLRDLLNQGGFELAQWGSSDRDRYGRLLRTVMRDGHSIGEALIAEGLARPWKGSRHSWCDQKTRDTHAGYT